MYHWVEDKDFLKRSYSYCADIVNQLVQNLKRYEIDSEMYIVGSKKRNMITQNANESIDYDFNLLIKNADDFHDAHELKEVIRKAFNEVLYNNDLKDCDDSTSALTTKHIAFLDGNKTDFYIDLCIVKRNSCGLHRLIHQKTGFSSLDSWIWNQVSNSHDLREKEESLKPDHWQEVRDIYIHKKNTYLKRPNDHDHPSFICYIEAVNEIYDKVKPNRASNYIGWSNPFLSQTR